MTTAPGAAELRPDGDEVPGGGDILGSQTGSEGGLRDGSADAHDLACPDTSDDAHGVAGGGGDPRVVEHPKDASHEDGSSTSSKDTEDADRSGGDVDEDSAAQINTNVAPQPAEETPGFESTPGDNSDPNSKASSECEDEVGCFSDGISELSDGEKLASELRRAEIRRGKAREGSPVPSKAPLEAVSDSQQSGELRGDSPEVPRDEAPMAGPASGGDPDVVYVPWEKDPERPLQKLPIRFRDLNGRTFLLPWDKVKTWKVRFSATRRP